MPRFSRAPKIHFSSTRTRENKTPIFNRRCIIISVWTGSCPFLLTPIFLFPWRKLHFGRLERDDLQVHAAIGTDDDLTGFGSLFQGEFCSTFGTRYSGHDYSPLGLRFFQRLKPSDFSQLIFDGLWARAANRISLLNRF